MNKNLQSGFTLAEVLMTLAIIGIVAAIVMPSVITSYQCKTVGVKLAKFASTLENSARAFVVQNDSFKTTDKGKADINIFLNESLIFKEIEVPNGITLLQEYKTGLLGDVYKDATEIGIDGTEVETKGEDGKTTKINTNLIGVMKDGTKVQVLPLSTYTGAADWSTNNGPYKDNMRMISSNKVGSGAFVIVFDPAVTGLTKDAHRAFTFVVTELGYMYPAATDDCLWSIYADDYVTNSKTFKGSSACLISNN